MTPTPYIPRLARNTDGSILVQAYRSGTAAADVLLLRYLLDGTLDATFGTGGVIEFDQLRYGFGVVVRPDGRILMGAVDTSFKIVLVQLEADGTPDATFGTGGLVADTESGLQGTASLLLLPDGKILVGATSGSIGPLFIRYEANGARDLTFGSGGAISEPQPGHPPAHHRGASTSKRGRSCTKRSSARSHVPPMTMMSVAWLLCSHVSASTERHGGADSPQRRRPDPQLAASAGSGARPEPQLRAPRHPRGGARG